MQEDFDKLVKPEQYQVFLLSCRPSLPLSFARHPWFVVNKKGALSRYEVVASPGMYGLGHAHLIKDGLPLWRGLRIVRSLREWGYIWPATLHGVIEGGEGSLAHRIVEYIEKSLETYPYSNRYSYTSPNSNTYIQWVLNAFPDSGLKLPWNAFGKRFKEKI